MKVKVKLKKKHKRFRKKEKKKFAGKIITVEERGMGVLSSKCVPRNQRNY